MSMIIALLLMLAAQPLGPSDEVASFYGNIDGTTYVSVLTRAAIEQSPRWHADEDAPPLAPGAAIRAASAQLQTLTGDITRWRVHDAQLRPLLFADAWVYVVEFGPVPPQPPQAAAPPGLTGTRPAVTGGVAGSFASSPMPIVVLMNGEAVTPRPRTR